MFCSLNGIIIKMRLQLNKFFKTKIHIRCSNNDISIVSTAPAASRKGIGKAVLSVSPYKSPPDTILLCHVSRNKYFCSRLGINRL